jgi:putative tryptophan/tyrosine transport system substrate-binding protein
MRRREFISLIAGATAWPLAARAQHPAMPVVGFLHIATAEGNAYNVAGFRRGLAEAGYVEGKNVTVEYHFANFKPELMSEAAGGFVRRNVSVIFAAEPAAVVVARNTTTSIPVVGLDLESDPLAKGYVKSLAAPWWQFYGGVS